MKSFSVRCIFLWHSHPAIERKFLYEERICIWRASDIDSAIKRAEKEARIYAAHTNVEFLELSQAFHLFDDLSEDSFEVFSLLRESDLDPDAYLDHFFDTGVEREQK